MTTLKQQTDSIINRNGLCPESEVSVFSMILCAECYYHSLCNKYKTNAHIVKWANIVKDNNYNIEQLLFDELL